MFDTSSTFSPLLTTEGSCNQWLCTWGNFTPVIFTELSEALWQDLDNLPSLWPSSCYLSPTTLPRCTGPFPAVTQTALICRHSLLPQTSHLHRTHTPRTIFQCSMILRQVSDSVLSYYHVDVAARSLMPQLRIYLFIINSGELTSQSIPWSPNQNKNF